MICGKAQGYIIRMQRSRITPKQKATLRYTLRRHVMGCKNCNDVWKNSQKNRRMTRKAQK